MLLLFAAANAQCHQKVTITKVCDGDTVQIGLPEGKVNVRMVGIDCYETRKIHRAYHQAYDKRISIDEVLAKGKQASEILQKIIAQDPNKIYFDFQGIDRYGRALGVLYIKNKNINKMMQTTGLCPQYEYRQK